MTMRKRDFTGERFGMLVAIKPLPKKEGMRDRPRWLCRCDCGNTIELYSDNLTHGRKSCGCLKGKRLKDFPSEPIEFRPEDSIESGNAAVIERLKPQLYCKMPDADCPINNACGICCCECDKKSRCEMACRNNPAACGGSERREKRY